MVGCLKSGFVLQERRYVAGARHSKRLLRRQATGNLLCSRPPLALPALSDNEVYKVCLGRLAPLQRAHISSLQRIFTLIITIRRYASGQGTLPNLETIIRSDRYRETIQNSLARRRWYHDHPEYKGQRQAAVQASLLLPLSLFQVIFHNTEQGAFLHCSLCAASLLTLSVSRLVSVHSFVDS